jgi:hypothetical protein
MRQTMSRGFLICVMLVLVGCSLIQVAYNRAEGLAYWWLDDKLHFSPSQADQVHASLSSWLAWHRQTQLPLYSIVLARSQQEARQTVSSALACQRRVELEGLVRVALDAAVPHLARLALSLTPAQLGAFEAYVDKRNSAYQDRYLPAKPAERDQAALDFVVQWVEVFYGDLHEAQHAHLARDVKAMPVDAQVLYDLRLSLQGRFLGLARRLIAQRASQVQAEREWRAHIQDAFEPSQPDMRSRYARWYEAGCTAVAALHNGSQASQREHMVAVLHRWEDDATALSAPLRPVSN